MKNIQARGRNKKVWEGLSVNERMDRTKLCIGAYILQPYARTERHIKEVADCGINFIVAMGYDRPALDLFLKYGLGAIVSGVVPGWWGGKGQNAGTMSEKNPLSKCEEAAKNFEDHPAIWGIDCGDEPSALDFEHYGKIIALTEKLFPHQFAYANIYPGYAAVAENTGQEVLAQLGTATYEEYIEQYIRRVPTDYISYDHYMYSTRDPSRAYSDLRIVSDACRRTGRSMWIVLQVNSNRENESISENRMRHQAFSALAFGAEVITWGCYTAGWWHDNVLDQKGEKTGQYDKLKKVNGELSRMGEVYMQYKNAATHFVGAKDAAAFEKVGASPVRSLNAGVFGGVRAQNGEALLVGHMKKRAGGGEALMIADAQDPWGDKNLTYNILFDCEGSNVRAYRNGEQIPLSRAGGTYSAEMTSCGGLLITAED